MSGMPGADLDEVVRAVPGVVALYRATNAPGLVRAVTAAAHGGAAGRVVVSADGAEAFVSVGVASSAGARTVARAVQEAVRRRLAATGPVPVVRVRVAQVK